MALIGRDRELARVKGAIQDAGAPVLLITGPSGAGKTALVEGAIAELGGGVLRGSGTALGPVRIAHCAWSPRDGARCAI